MLWRKSWFEKLTGFPENPQKVRDQFELAGSVLKSRANDRELRCGVLAIPSLGELREEVEPLQGDQGLVIREVVADAQALHTESANEGAMFQVASQFNLLEMVSPSVTPEAGISGYENDRTQGPACAIAAGAGTIYRNYFVPIDGQIGQTAARQIDCLEDLGAKLGNGDGRLWTMQNGYALCSADGLEAIARQLSGMNPRELDELRGALRVGIQWNTEVTLDERGHSISQIYCSALPVAYSHHAPALWEPFARLVLEATYEAAFCAATLNSRRFGSRSLFLTLVGGGAFGNAKSWILDAIRRAARLFQGQHLEVAIVSYGRSDRDVRRFVAVD